MIFMPDIFSITWWRKVYSKLGRVFGWGCALVFAIPLVIGFGWNQFSGHDNQRNTSSDSVIATVNGIPITMGEYRSNATRQSGNGEQAASAQGQAVEGLIYSKLLNQLATKRNVHVNEADVDKQIKEIREQLVGAKGSDSDWEGVVFQKTGKTTGEFRESLTQSPNTVQKALLESYKGQERVTDQDIKNQSTEVQLATVLISYGPPSPFNPSKSKAKPLTEMEAKLKAESLQAEARGGKDIASIARKNSADFTSAKGGDTGLLPEYKAASPQSANGYLDQAYGKDFAEVVHKTATGLFTDVVKTTGFNKGYVFAKVTSRKNTPAKGTDPKKEGEAIREQRATVKLTDEVKVARNAAQVVFKPDAAEVKPYYDYFKLQEMQQKQATAMFGGGDTKDIPTPADIDKQQALVDTGFEQLLKKRSDDSTAALIVSKSVKKHLATAPPAEKPALRDRLISLYETALKSTEDRAIRLELVDLYRDKNDLVSAGKLLTKMSYLLNIDSPFGLEGLQDALSARQQLEAKYRSLNKLEEADAEKKKINELLTKIVAEKKKTPAPGGGLPPGMKLPTTR